MDNTSDGMLLVETGRETDETDEPRILEETLVGRTVEDVGSTGVEEGGGFCPSVTVI